MEAKYYMNAIMYVVKIEFTFAFSSITSRVSLKNDSGVCFKMFGKAPCTIVFAPIIR